MAESRREVGDGAVWSLSSAKPGNGVDQLRDNNTDTYWQSDGMQPHVISIQFPRKMTIKEVALYMDYKLDESYTPKKIVILSGSTVHDLKEINVQHFAEPDGWVFIPLHVMDGSKQAPLRTFFLQIVILAMHQNGRDTHIRQVKIYAPRETQMLDWSISEFTTPQFAAYSCIR
ncbi:anaphase-promoting complex subunit 10 [Plasmopara halstedii]|uniref:Anaphase-promoting complex subunit 10 n=1 Tax=Plasmopara halstedii TaxID=4781 RepID=A0A0P1AH42_PLAHL|nr:anaphase-promoting complex subunit 10 [Plasmopara halstedii]CEG39981.1 anaphase-promoting complex subunit 10 [Plasmopara halstedii]|eukprot:XP_024576350.1 anaphase-promoting complex subunit 10 [Plasmopara halstedii]